MSARPLVRVFDAATGAEAGQVNLPDVFTSPIRTDVVQQVHTSMAKNKRQAYAVSAGAGHQTSAQSWGTGRAVARIPRVGGGGTSRSGQGAFGNMCRGGHMYAPTKTWRRWHRKINVNQRRYAVCSALAASAVPALVQARGHRVEQVPEVPLVVANMESTKKTRDAYAILARIGASADVDKAKASKKVRAGKGKMRNRRYVMRRGPLVVYAEDNGIVKAFRNLPGVELCQVDRLNLLQLAPGGTMGRFIVWSQGAFERLDALYGTNIEKSQLKAGYQMPRTIMANADLASVINSTDVQEFLRPAVSQQRYSLRKRNPLKNRAFMDRLNPYHKEIRAAEAAGKARAAAKARQTAERRNASKAFVKAISSFDFIGVNGQN